MLLFAMALAFLMLFMISITLYIRSPMKEPDDERSAMPIIALNSDGSFSVTEIFIRHV